MSVGLAWDFIKILARRASKKFFQEFSVIMGKLLIVGCLDCPKRFDFGAGTGKLTFHGASWEDFRTQRVDLKRFDNKTKKVSIWFKRLLEKATYRSNSNGKASFCLKPIKKNHLFPGPQLGIRAVFFTLGGERQGGSRWEEKIAFF